MTHQAAFSPDFRSDHTIFLATVTRGFPHNVNDVGLRQPSSDHEQSVGVLISNDGGISWRPSSQGQEVGGTPYRHVQRITVSSTYARDGTLFAFAWGPREPTRGFFAPSGTDALFRSRDRGASWEEVPARDGGYSFGRMALSPSFSVDGMGVIVISGTRASPTSGSCQASLTTDAGDTWTDLDPRSSFQGCSAEAFFLDVAGRPTALLRTVHWSWSSDGGATWHRLSRPAGADRNMVDASFDAVFVSPPSSRGSTLFLGTRDEALWGQGPGIASIDGTLPCPATAIGGFGRVWNSSPEVRSQLGCPPGAERAVRIREKTIKASGGGYAVGYWTEDDSPTWFEAQGGDYLWTNLKDKTPWPVEGNERIVEGVVQSFEGGVMLWLPNPEGQHVILVLAPLQRRWREFPDPPAGE